MTNNIKIDTCATENATWNVTMNAIDEELKDV